MVVPVVLPQLLAVLPLPVVLLPPLRRTSQPRRRRRRKSQTRTWVSVYSTKLAATHEDPTIRCQARLVDTLSPVHSCQMLSVADCRERVASRSRLERRPYDKYLLRSRPSKNTVESVTIDQTNSIHSE